MAAPRQSTERTMRRVGAVLTGLGILLIGAGVMIGFLVAPLGFLIAAIGLVDLLVARQYVSGRHGNVIIPGLEDDADADTVAAESASPAVPAHPDRPS